MMRALSPPFQLSHAVREPRSGTGFWEQVRREARGTWGGRRAPLRIGLAIAVLLLVGLVPCPGLLTICLGTLKNANPGGVSLLPTLGDLPFLGLCAAACWAPAWLCADLFATRCRENPEPLRERAPRQLLARALGRLLPFYAALGVWVAVYTGRALVVDLSPTAGAGLFTAGLQIENPEQLPAWWAAWVAVFLVSGLPYAAAAALMSATARRPRRLVVTPVVVVFGSLLMLEAAALATGPPSVLRETLAKGRIADLLPYVAMPNFWAGYGSSLALRTFLHQGPAGLIAAPGSTTFPEICWGASAAFLIYTLVMLTAAARIARRRRR